MPYARRWPDKDPDASLPHAVDWSLDLASGVTITGTPTISATPSGLTFGTPVVAAAIVTFMISGGTAGVDYAVTTSVVFSNGGDDDWTQRLYVTPQ